MAVRRQIEFVREAVTDGTDRVRPILWLVVPLLAVCWNLVEAAERVVGDVSLTEDAALFYYSGRQWVQAGRVPYRHLWDIKPPLIHETAAALALLTGGDPFATYVVGNALNVAALLGGVAAGMVAVRELTDSRVAGATVGVACLALPQLFARIVTGLRPKYVVVLLLGLVLLTGVRERWVAAGGLAAATAGFWQPGLTVLVAVLATVWWGVSRGDIPSKVGDRTVLAIVGVALVAVVPVAVGGALPELIVQAVVAPLVTADTGVTGKAVVESVHPTLLPLAALGTVAVGVRATERARWWPGLFLAAFALVMLSGDFDGVADLIPLSFLVAVGAGAAVGAAAPTEPRALSSDPRVWLLALVGVWVWLSQPPIVPSRTAGPIRELFLTNGLEQRCHLRLSDPESQMMRLLDSAPDAPTCWRPDWWP